LPRGRRRRDNHGPSLSRRPHRALHAAAAATTAGNWPSTRINDWATLPLNLPNVARVSDGWALASCGSYETGTGAAAPSRSGTERETMVKQIEVGREYRVLSNDAYVPAGSTALVIRIVEETGLPLCRIETKAGVRLVALTLCSLDEQVGEPLRRNRYSTQHCAEMFADLKTEKREEQARKMRDSWTTEKREAHAAKIVATWTSERRKAMSERMRQVRGGWRETMPEERVIRIQQLHRSGIGCRRLAQQFGMPRRRIESIVKEALV
jgi:hypothetical protein